jgi:uncharacterized protein (DUF983 family)
MNDLTKTTLKRGFFNRCPSCGEGKLLRGFTTPHKCCSHCHLDFEPLRADDGPAWATILIAGHLSMPFVFFMLDLGLDNMVLEISASIAFILGISALILPRAKGMFMSVIWQMHIKKEAVE